MAKKSKLIEKRTRIPEIRHVTWDKTIPEYLREVEKLNTESARSHRFTALLQQLLGVDAQFIEDYVRGIETYLKVKQKDRILRGKSDNLFGNLVIEFEKNIPKHLRDAEEQLQRYVSILWSNETAGNRTPYICIACDGVRFVIYSPQLSAPASKDIAPENVQLRVIEKADWTKLKPQEIFFWLDRYFLRKEILPPTTETIVRDFGAASHAFQTATDALLKFWQGVKDQSAFATIYENWEKYLRIVYGTQVGADELFVRHTYLATLAKSMAWMRLAETQSMPDSPQIARMLEGTLFKEQGVENFIEEDFFSWLARPPALDLGIGIVRGLFSLLQNYNLRELSEDVLKSLYQELVDPETRHDLGEFYTPDWLAHRIVRHLLDRNARGSMLDPACGSGTFLYLAIREKRGRLGNRAETLSHILQSVQGADIHPLAVIIAKTNYILALGDLLSKRKDRVTLPVYLSDTIKLPQQDKQPSLFGLPSYKVALDGQEVHLPEKLLEVPADCDRAIELAKEYARQNKRKTVTLSTFGKYLGEQHSPLAADSALTQAVFDIAVALKELIEAERDTIQAFILKNIYKPLAFRRKFDFIMGNPPWIAFRYLEPGYQNFIKAAVTKETNNAGNSKEVKKDAEYRLLKGRGELITHLEIGTFFFVRAADLYLGDSGVIAFVLPRSIFSGDQHDALRKRTFRLHENPLLTLAWEEVWDCEEVNPLFSVPSCVLIAAKRETSDKQATAATLKGWIIGGKLKHKNCSLDQADKSLNVQKAEFHLHTQGKRSFWATGKQVTSGRESHYKKGFAEGATIVPRSFWFVRVKPSPLGFNPKLPPLETDPRAMEEAKAPYRDVKVEGNVECRFLYATLISADLLPFGHFDYRPVVLPVESVKGEYKLLDAAIARERGVLHLARWLERAEEEWSKRRRTKAKGMSVLAWLDYRRKLTSQDPTAKYFVLYNKSGTFLTAAVVKNRSTSFNIGRQEVRSQGFVADHVTYLLPLSDEREACFLAAALNSPYVDARIKPMQSRGQFGPRDIHKKVLELPIPQFDEKSRTHHRLAELGQECTDNVRKWIKKDRPANIRSIGKLRSLVRTMLKPQLTEIDKLVKEILK